MFNRFRALACSLISLFILSGSAQATVILQYHHIDDSTPASTSTIPALFAEHLKWLQDNQFTVLHLPAVAELIRTGQPLPDKSAVITFDDAYESIHTKAFPLLKKYNYPFTIFIDTLSVDQKRNRALTWAQLREMGGNRATLANHTVNHAHLVEKLSGESTVQWLERVRNNLEAAEARIKEETGQNHRLFAWPYGESAPELEQLILENSYLGFGQQSGPVGSFSNKAKLPRFPMGGGYGSMKNFPLKVNSLPLPVISVSPETSVAPLNGQLGQLQLTLKSGQWSNTQIACYALGSNLQLDWTNKQKTTLDISLPDLPLGRSRVNCTSPGPDGRWFWFSKEWVRLNKEGKALD